MTRKIQKEIEKYFVEQFAIQMNYDWNVIIPENEQKYPDLLIETANNTFGLEVRELFKDEIFSKGSNLKKTEQSNIRTMQNLSYRYYKKSKRPILVKIYGKIASYNIDIILDILIDSKVNEYENISKYLPTSDGLVSIHITGLPSKFESYSDWQNISDNIGFVKLLNTNSIEEIIRIKAINLSKYSQIVNVVSLLLYCSHSFSSGMIRFTVGKELNKFGFKHVYLYEHLLNGYQY